MCMYVGTQMYLRTCMSMNMYIVCVHAFVWACAHASVCVVVFECVEKRITMCVFTCACRRMGMCTYIHMCPEQIGCASTARCIRICGCMCTFVVHACARAWMLRLGSGACACSMRPGVGFEREQSNDDKYWPDTRS